MLDKMPATCEKLPVKANLIRMDHVGIPVSRETGLTRPLCVDLFCGLGGWSEGFLAEGWDCVGFDVERHRYPRPVAPSEAVKRPGLDWSDRSKRGSKGAQFNRPPEVDSSVWDEYPGELVLQDVLTLHGSQFRHADMIVASPPCQRYSYMAMPWRRAKTEIAWQRWFRDSGSPFADRFSLNDLFDACFRLQREANEAIRNHCVSCGFHLLSHHRWCGCECSRFAGGTRYIPMVVENVKGAQPWVGRAKWHYGSYYLWGDVPALMPLTSCSKTIGHVNKRDGNSHIRHLTNQRESDAVKNHGGSWFNESHNTESGTGKNPVHDGVKAGGDWFGPGKDCSPMRRCVISARKAASAQIAKIPFELSRYIASVFRPVAERDTGSISR